MASRFWFLKYLFVWRSTPFGENPPPGRRVQSSRLMAYLESERKFKKNCSKRKWSSSLRSFYTDDRPRTGLGHAKRIVADDAIIRARPNYSQKCFSRVWWTCFPRHEKCPQQALLFQDHGWQLSWSSFPKPSGTTIILRNYIDLLVWPLEQVLNRIYTHTEKGINRYSTPVDCKESRY